MCCLSSTLQFRSATKALNVSGISINSVAQQFSIFNANIYIVDCIFSKIQASAETNLQARNVMTYGKPISFNQWQMMKIRSVRASIQLSALQVQQRDDIAMSQTSFRSLPVIWTNFLSEKRREALPSCGWAREDDEQTAGDCMVTVPVIPPARRESAMTSLPINPARPLLWRSSWLWRLIRTVEHFTLYLRRGPALPLALISASPKICPNEKKGQGTTLLEFG